MTRASSLAPYLRAVGRGIRVADWMLARLRTATIVAAEARVMLIALEGQLADLEIEAELRSHAGASSERGEA